MSDRRDIRAPSAGAVSEWVGMALVWLDGAPLALDQIEEDGLGNDVNEAIRLLRNVRGRLHEIAEATP